MIGIVVCGQRALHTAARVLRQNLSSFSFAGARTLNDIMKKELLVDKSADEISDLWTVYHKEKENVHGVVLTGQSGKSVLERAKDCPFFIQPVFRDDGFFMLVSQFQAPSYFLMAYLEDYKTDPTSAHPLLTFSVFDDFSDQHDLTLVRCDVVNKGIPDEESVKVVTHVLDSYKEDDGFESVLSFNKTPEQFDVDDYISRQNQKWKNET